MDSASNEATLLPWYVLEMEPVKNTFFPEDGCMFLGIRAGDPHLRLS
jgi:hypothetical protein